MPQQEGTVAFKIIAKEKSYWIDDREHKFPNPSSHGIAVGVTKLADKTLHVTVRGPLYTTTEFNVPVPTMDSATLSVAITWKFPEVTLFLNGKRVQVQKPLRPN